MAKLPDGFSLQATPIQNALSEGRDADATTMVVELLRSGKADTVVMGIAADLLKPKKRGRGRRKSLPWYWMDIHEAFTDMRHEGALYQDALEAVAKRFGVSEGHVRTCLRTYQEAVDECAQEDRN